MRLFPPEPVIGLNDGFNEHDIFGYDKFGEQLKDFYASFDDPLVGVLDAPWGSGKSTFIKMWCGYMRNAGYPVIEFDAFKNDYTDDAFMALAGEVLLLAEDLNGDSTDVRKKFTEKATDVIVAASKGGLKAFAKKAFTEEGAEEVGAALAGAAEGAVDGLEAAIKEKLQSRRKEKATFDSFAEAFSTLSEQLGRSEGGIEKSKPLIFVIDELDRCKPTFALALLEKIKHFFSVPNVQFLLVTNLEQLSKVVKAEYGTEINGEIYLQKFYDVSFSLPRRNRSGHSAVERVFCVHVVGSCKTNINSELFKVLAESKQMCFRTILKVHAYAAAMIGAHNGMYDGFVDVYLGLACIKVQAPNMFRKAMSGTFSKSDVDAFFAGEAWEMTYCHSTFLFLLEELPQESEYYNGIARSFGYRFSKTLIQDQALKMAQLDFPQR
ncbi:KAP family P-loop NTPase fold protein [Halodesulfovibrio spirochaetisodalis]|uniref:KAP NTPase domain-containing protein n=1 Tax=Halodesulfovibrio spirochaetisodalis TaxID=1560234 RepID=A0A1B7X9L2_9BACT|nr:P-loop NTPase fold protein [Halodesulfovibrio spirochaetisodalis]OBQ46064.1 hypothetical protein SP90_14285 [Halodesulfovibrio spirochaetisodalis]